MKRRILKGTALAIDVGAPLIATLTQFPLWVDRSAGSTVSGLFVLFAILSAIPLLRYFREKIKTPSAPLVWGVGFALLTAINTIISEMIIITLVGLIANCIGWVLFKIAGDEE